MSSHAKKLAIGTLAACALAVAASPGHAGEPAASPTLKVSGGVLDPAFTDAEVYVGTPTAAKAPPICRAAATYVGLLSSGQFDRIAAAVYAEDAFIFSPQVHKMAVGRQAIDNFYRNYVGKFRPYIIPVAFVGGPHDCMMVMAARKTMGGQPRYVLSTIDHFTINAAGKASSMVAYSRPDNSPLAPRDK